MVCHAPPYSVNFTLLGFTLFYRSSWAPVSPAVPGHRCPPRPLLDFTLSYLPVRLDPVRFYPAVPQLLGASVPRGPWAPLPPAAPVSPYPGSR